MGVKNRFNVFYTLLCVSKNFNLERYMIENPNPRNFYSPKEMVDRQNYIPKMKSDLLDKLNDLKNKIETEEPFPHGNMDLDFLCEVSDKIDEVLNSWYY